MNRIIDKTRVKNIFADYVSDFDASDGMISLKIVHTYNVADLCEKIAVSLHKSEQECDLAWLLGMLHDLGRFVQIREYGTFDDARSINHALGSIRVLFEEGYIRKFIDSSLYDEIIDKAIRYHNVFRLPEDLDEETKCFCDILRDADKIDILRLDMELPLEDIYGEDIGLCHTQEISEKVFNEFMRESAILRANISNQIDRIIGHASMAFELVFPLSRRIVRERGYSENVLNIATENEKAHEQLVLMRAKMNTFISAEDK